MRGDFRLSKYSKFKKKTAPSGKLSIGGPTITKEMLTPGQLGAFEVFFKWFTNKKKRSQQILRIGGGGGSGKAQPDNTIIPTPKGPRRLDELEIGDKVFNLYGEPVEILGIYPQGKCDTYEVTFSDGRKTRCNLDHVWTTITSKGNFKNRTLREMIDDYESVARPGHLVHKYKIPMPSPIQYKYREVPVDPYVLGALIGNGCLSESALTISSGNLYVPAEIARIIGHPINFKRPYSYSYTFYVDNHKQSRCRPDGLATVKTAKFFKNIPEIINCRSGDKFIPDIYKYNSVEVRLALLQGLMDTDGHISKDKYRISYYTISTKLKDDVVELVRSLGYGAYVTKDHRIDKYKTGVCYKIHITCPDEDKRKLFRVNPRSKRLAKEAASYKTHAVRDQLTLIDIKKVEKCSQRCIYIDDPLHVYITENFIPTHNTYFTKFLIDFFGWDRTECYVMSYTGQSVNVLREYGIYSGTIHSMIMIPQEEPILDKETGEPIIRHGIPLTTVKFKPVRRLPSSVQLIIIDEASFLPEDLEKILSRYNVPILEIGDPIQLPPVTGKQVFNMDTLDYFIEGVMRQHKDNEIYILSTKFRKGEHINPKAFGKEVRFLQQQETVEETFMRFLPMFRDADVIITGTNKQREIITKLYREVILKADSPFPLKGERVICRKNNQAMTLGDFMLTNGMQGIAVDKVGRSMVDKSTDTFMMDFLPDVTSANPEVYFDDLICDTSFLMKPFGQMDTLTYKHLGEKFEYAHAITTHLSQGAQYPKVLYFDSLNRDREYLNRMRYTAVTRARVKLWYLIPYHGEWSL